MPLLSGPPVLAHRDFFSQELWQQAEMALASFAKAYYLALDIAPPASLEALNFFDPTSTILAPSPSPPPKPFFKLKGHGAKGKAHALAKIRKEPSV